MRWKGFISHRRTIVLNLILFQLLTVPFTTKNGYFPFATNSPDREKIPLRAGSVFLIISFRGRNSGPNWQRASTKAASQLGNKCKTCEPTLQNIVCLQCIVCIVQASMKSIVSNTHFAKSSILTLQVVYLRQHVACIINPVQSNITWLTINIGSLK